MFSTTATTGAGGLTAGTSEIYYVIGAIDNRNDTSERSSSGMKSLTTTIF
jgi:hypothetical protein